MQNSNIYKPLSHSFYQVNSFLSKSSETKYSTVSNRLTEKPLHNFARGKEMPPLTPPSPYNSSKEVICRKTKLL